MTGAVRTELLKLKRSLVVPLTFVAYAVGPIVGGLFMFIIKEPGRAQQLGLIGQKAQFAGGTADWPSYFALLVQTTGLGGMILFSVIAAYVFGREYADGTAKNMLALPVPREGFVLAKLIVIALWVAALTAFAFVLGLAVGGIVELPGYSAQAVLTGAREIAFATSVAFLLLPVIAWIATLGRGYLPPLGWAIFTLVLGNVFGATGWGKWFPWAIVPLYAGVAGPRQTQLVAGSYVVLALTFVLGIGATVAQLRWGDNTQ